MKEREELLYLAASAKSELMAAERLLREAAENMRICGNVDGAEKIKSMLETVKRTVDDHFAFLRRGWP